MATDTETLPPAPGSLERAARIAAYASGAPPALYLHAVYLAAIASGVADRLEEPTPLTDTETAALAGYLRKALTLCEITQEIGAAAIRIEHEAGAASD